MKQPTPTPARLSLGEATRITASAARDLVNQSVRIGTQQAGAMQVGADGIGIFGA